MKDPQSLALIMSKPGYYRVKITTKQPATLFAGCLSDGTIKIRLAAVPERGKANAELIRFVAEQLGIARERIRISNGLTSPLKIVAIEAS